MISKQQISEIISNYDLNDLAIATVCSHSSLQIFDGARKEGLRTIGICVGQPPRFYDAFPKAKPDEYIVVESYSDIPKIAEELVRKNAIVIPHGSFVEYMGTESFAELAVPTFGNREVLEWESDRDKEREWLEGAGIHMPKIVDPEKIESPVMVKYHGAKGGRGFFIAKDYEEFKQYIDPNEKHTVQEFIVGTRYYLHFFYSPIREEGYKLSEGILEMLSMDRRVESNADEIFRLGSPKELEDAGIHPTYVVTGNVPLVARESLLPRIFALGEKVVEESLGLFGGMIGPFCLETVFTDKLEIKVFEISARIVAGTNLYTSGSPYSDMIEENLSTGKRIAQEIKLGAKTGKLDLILS
ncbi:formate--phosphoribosylaminoimidazolecarboxamide ligase [Methanococcoides burtonii]|uniref:5-formaminoimidazole-4-carboxamide-1-(beta)-D-ribofuranosyl 5'-monophosphate synthetase n=1 Tax=Methanococcoides burtonii (strain DSM 6242 / NBRC 107633 / OCM 468 / ACE-M) TaxID=259564 RepID=PURP_METBU|nr:formate--phosphoribosylaminoimidazolecarboxamide ligase [Methanococcoides burtonii]Q12VJ6.1 RecName: Full=5-formaminoimidazole-4-carboxamide-1-(beta)-D-ribofuranosyl 5'-monophosphate synthetase; AltName: Full=5-aminoimidazole-4-carboxamide-1-beta-D-ribofuranosyl 5'-monophosphate--formate ligase [Methanococcoides burtonii DSM 6242]ABE52530.1 5-formaminoimidazole-4-carboxamide-1-(beta)-D-ribofuranosyl 5'-monophosphate synthetase [Methanococcoides burtonii DSM 6242]